MDGILGQAMQQPPQPGPAPQAAPQQGGDPVERSAVELVIGPLQSPDGQQMIMQRLQQGASDPEKTIAEIAGNLTASALNTAKENGKDIPGKALTTALKACIRVVLDVAVQAGMVPQEQAKAMAQRILPLAAHVVQNGPDSFE